MFSTLRPEIKRVQCIVHSNEALVEDGEAVNIDNLIESDVENNSEDEDQENSELNIEDED
ncbi:unnamed protein product, partial [Didymodactylos carnosus]